jgi:hypothetical protein
MRVLTLEKLSDMVLQAFHGSVIHRLKRMKEGASWRAKRRGIEICPEWSADSSTFVQYVLHNHAHTFWRQSRMGWFRIERVDPSVSEAGLAKGYEPGNVRFVPGEESSAGRRRRGGRESRSPTPKVIYPVEDGIPLPSEPEWKASKRSKARKRP